MGAVYGKMTFSEFSSRFMPANRQNQRRQQTKKGESANIVKRSLMREVSQLVGDNVKVSRSTAVRRSARIAQRNAHAKQIGRTRRRRPSKKMNY